MKKFVFRLETLLRIRRAKEEEAQSELALAIRRYQEEHAILLQLESKQNEFILEFRHHQGQALNVELFKNYHCFFDKIRRDIISRQTEVQLAEQAHKQCLIVLDEAVKNRKVVEKLKERQQAKYTAEMLVQEQKVLDELGMQVFLRNS